MQSKRDKVQSKHLPNQNRQWRYRGHVTFPEQASVAPQIELEAQIARPRNGTGAIDSPLLRTSTDCVTSFFLSEENLENGIDLCHSSEGVNGAPGYSRLSDCFVTEPVVLRWFEQQDSSTGKPHPHPWDLDSSACLKLALSDSNFNPSLPSYLKAELVSELSRPDRVCVWSFAPGLFRETQFEVRLKPQASLTSVPCPRWPPGQERYLRETVHRFLRFGLVELASPFCEAAVRPHIVPKIIPHPERKNDFVVSKLRFTQDYIPRNPSLVFPLPNIPDPDVFRDSFVGFQYLGTFDLSCGFFHGLVKEDCRDLLAFWTPQGIMRPTRCPMGVSSAPGWFQSAMEHSSNFGSMACYGRSCRAYMDDLPHGGHTWKEYLQTVCEIVDAAVACGARFAPDKARFGFYELPIIGQIVGRHGKKIPVSKSEPLLRMERSSFVDQTSVRVYLGMVNYLNKYVPNLATILSPLHRLVGKVSFDFDDKCWAAVRQVNRIMAAGPVLSAPNWDWPFIIQTDADLPDGCGGVLCQRDPSLPSPEIKGGKSTAQDKRPLRVIHYVSHKWTTAQRKWHVYVKEAYGIMFNVRRSLYYLQASRFVTQIETDQQPLIWLEHATSPLVMGWVTQWLWQFRWRVVYVKGVNNGLADGLSRPPVIAPGRLAPEGVEASVKALLPLIVIPPGPCSVWVYLREAESLKKLFVAPNRVVEHKSPTIGNIESLWDVAIIIPGTEQSPIVARNLFRVGKPFALLIPVDLVSFIAEGCPDVEPLLEETKKIMFLNQHLLWLVWRFGVSQHEVFNVELILAETESKQVSRADIAQAQKRDGIDGSSPLLHAELRSQASLQRGLWGINEDDHFRVLVPSSLVAALIWAAHLRFNHARSPRLYRFLRPRFLFLTPEGGDGTEGIIRSTLDQCHFCAVARARKQVTHGKLSSMEWTSSGQCLCFDHFSVDTPSREGHTKVLTVVDPLGPIGFFPVVSTGAAEWLDVLVSRWFCFYDPPEAFFSDNGRSFRSTLGKMLCSSLSIKQLFSGPHAPWMNGIAERAQQCLIIALRALPPTEKDLWHLTLPMVTRAEMIAVPPSGISRFELTFGRPPVSSLDLMLSSDLSEQRATNNMVIDPLSLVPALRNSRGSLQSLVFTTFAGRQIRSETWHPAVRSGFEGGILPPYPWSPEDLPSI